MAEKKTKNEKVDKNEHIINYDELSSYKNSDISSRNMNNEDEEIMSKAKDNFIQTDFYEKLIKYVKTDDLIRKETVEHREKMNTLKDEKMQLEEYIIRYLDSKKQDIINHNKGKIIKCESIRKSALNQEVIKQSIYEQLKHEKIFDDDEKCKELAEKTFTLMNDKRDVTKRVYLKRTFERKKKEKVEKKPNKKKETKK